MSDTVFVETVGTESLLSKDIKLNFNMENETIWVKGEIPSGTILEMYDAMGKKIFDKKLEATQSIPSVPSGIYFAVATHTERGRQILKIPIF